MATRSSRYGRILTDGAGRTLYIFTRETSSRTRCDGACAQNWPPFIARGGVAAGAGASAGLLATTTRPDGRTQVTYHGRPLYYYVGDRKPGEILCQNVVEFGGTWLVADPSGQPVQG